MKIEMGESLVYSYLKHIEGCRVVQTNWKTSGEWVTTEYENNHARSFYDKIVGSEEFKDIFGSNSFEQLMKQAEIDVLGLNTTENSVFAIDVAFHTGGMNYGGSEVTARKVIMKIFRAIIIMLSYFNGFDKFNSWFVAPKVHNSTLNPTLDLIEKANLLINDELINIRLVTNEEFYHSMVIPLIENTTRENDMGELFLRSVKLLSLAPEPIDYHKKPTTRSGSVGEKKTVDSMKIGQFVQYQMKRLYDKGLISTEEIERLKDAEHCKKVFNQNFEVLRGSEKEIFGVDGRNRYYVKDRYCGDNYLTSQWVERHWEPFMVWMEKLGPKG